ncbi:MAG: SusC/RagA family TonB-linked outer membrane protein [Bacteroidetes bacterium]|nr:SusC/RagA family TonB-linked outer membrane protein [Bacteroidota bacterium]
MRWTFIIITVILAAFLSAKADDTRAQANLDTKVTLQLQNATLKSALKLLSEKAKVDFAYNTQAIPLNDKVSITANDEPLGDVLTKLITPLGLNYRVIGKNILIEKTSKKSEESKSTDLQIPITNPANSFYVTGFVTDSLKNPLVGATVANKTKNTSTVSDDVGKFQIIADEGDQIVITFIGYKSYSFKTSQAQNIVKITLVPVAQGLTEVVVSTGYQKLPQERATGSFDFVNNKTINQQVGSNILDRINGVANGVLFVNNLGLSGGPSNGLMIRGLSTINGLKDPLIVVDNFPYSGNISNINPNDVEDITILKDAAAASIWGVKAANGVVVITTKKGRLNTPTEINFNAGLIVTGNPNLHSLRTIGASDYVDLEQFLFDKGIYNVYDDVGPKVHVFPAFSPVIEALLAERRGAISADSATSVINSSKNTDIRDQYAKYMYQKATTQQYNLNIGGGGERYTYYISAGYDKNVDQLDAKNDRYTFRADNTFKITKDLSIHTNLQYTQTNQLTGKPAYGTIGVNNVQIPYLRFADQNGNPLPVALNWRKPYTDTAGNGKLLNWNYYPLTDWQHSYSKGKTDDIAGNVELNYKLFIKGLNASLSYLYESQHLDAGSLNDVDSYNARNLINQFSQINQSTGVVTYKVPLGGILQQLDSKLETNNIRGQLSYDNEFGKNRIDAIIGGERDQTQTISFQSLFYGYNPNNFTTVPVDFVNPYPNYINGRLATITSIGSPIQGMLNRFVSLFGNASYTYDGKYIVSGSARKDGSNLFGVTSNNKWNPLWSAGLSWIISKEAFYKSTSLPYLKIRGTYGYSGNTNPAIAALLTLRTVNGGSPTFLNVSQETNLPNPGLKWEKDRTINVGLDFETKNQVVKGSIDGYIKNGIDLYGPSPLDPTDGVPAQVITRNIADMNGKGLDADLKFLIINHRLKWSLGTFYSYNISKATKYYLDTSLRASSFYNSGLIIRNPVVGEPLYAVIAYKWAGLDSKGNPQGYYNGQLSEDYVSILNKTKKEDLIYKPGLPTHFGNISNMLSYGGFDFVVNVSYRFGYYFRKPTVNYGSLINNGAFVGTSDYAKRWRNPGDELKTNVPSFIYPDNSYRDAFYVESAANLDKADNIKLQYINLSYDLKRIMRGGNMFRQMVIYCNASNLGILWKANHDGIDPDYLSSTPIPGKTFSIGLRAGF